MPRRYKRNNKKRSKRRRFVPKQRTFRKTARFQLSNKVELVRPITLKPKSVLKKFIFYNTAEVRNGLIGGQQNAQFQTNYLNSAWMLQSDTYTQQGSNTWRWNQAMTAHTNPGDIATGTSFPGFGELHTGFGRQYANFCVLGAKVKITATPIQIANNYGGAVSALFAVIQTGQNQLTNTTTIDNIYALPYSQLRKIEGGDKVTGTKYDTKEASITIRYSPKRYNNIKDIRDNIRFFGKVNQDGTLSYHPAELDRVSFGVVNCMSNPSAQSNIPPIMLQYRHEVTVLFTEPHNAQNQAPAIPLQAMGNVVAGIFEDAV